MKFWLTITQLVGWLSPYSNDEDSSQQPLPASLDLPNPPSRIFGAPGNAIAPAVSEPVVPDAPVNDVQDLSVHVYDSIPSTPLRGPVFTPPGASHHWGGYNFECQYPDMKGYQPCSNSSDRTCWLFNPEKPNQRYDISSNYEDPSEKGTPRGILREYTLNVQDGTWNADGLIAKDVKLVNGTYPGPWIQACWGDTIRIKVINNLKHNGTAIHWHGIRQLETMHMDGVPGITQCPIAPGDSFTYEFRALQYGSSWYHSHYSVQYADGLLGPMTIHGPSSEAWDEPKLPVLMSDWFHNSAFGVVHQTLPGYTTTLLNGTGDVTKYKYPNRFPNGTVIKNSFHNVIPNAPVPAPFQLHFDGVNSTESKLLGRAKRYVLRLINTSFATTFLFSIDHHKLTVIGADFVPVYGNRTRKYLQVGIGQRYTVVVTADPLLYNETDSYGSVTQWEEGHLNFWIRTAIVPCFKTEAFPQLEYNKTGILRYDPNDTREPLTKPWRVTKDDLEDIRLENGTKIGEQVACKDEIELTPILPWRVPEIPKNDEKQLGRGEEFTVRTSLFGNKAPKQGDYPLAKWSFEKDAKDSKFYPLQIDYGNPFFVNLDKNLDDTKEKAWAKKWVVVDESHTEKDWVFLTITHVDYRVGTKVNDTAAHPIHLHGHDFAVVKYAKDEMFNATHKYAGTNSFTLWNPIRRDVILLPKNGWITIAFKTDNPGAWIMHCHIAFHASEGLALQINERQKDANDLFPRWPRLRPSDNQTSEANREAQRVCKRWTDFENDCTRHWPGYNQILNCWPACNGRNDTNSLTYACDSKKNPLPGHIFQDDSGI